MIIVDLKQMVKLFRSPFRETEERLDAGHSMVLYEGITDSSKSMQLYYFKNLVHIYHDLTS